MKDNFMRSNLNADAIFFAIDDHSVYTYIAIQAIDQNLVLESWRRHRRHGTDIPAMLDKTQ